MEKNVEKNYAALREKIRAWLAHGHTQTQLEAATGVFQPRISAFLLGKTLGFPNFSALCEYFNLDPATGESRAHGERNAAAASHVAPTVFSFPIYGFAEATPFPVAKYNSVKVGDDVPRLTIVESAWHAFYPNLDPAGLYVLQISGRSMEPRVLDGEKVFVRRVSSRRDVCAGNLVILQLPGEGTVFKIWRDGGILESINPSFPARACPKGAKIFGKVVARAGAM